MALISLMILAFAAGSTFCKITLNSVCLGGAVGAGGSVAAATPDELAPGAEEFCAIPDEMEAKLTSGRLRRVYN